MTNPTEPRQSKEPSTNVAGSRKDPYLTRKDRPDDGDMINGTEKGGGNSRSASVGEDPHSSPAASSHVTPEETELERRVLAHERILQSLIAHLAETEPAFLLRLQETFVESMRMASFEQDYTNTDAYAEQFIRSVVRLKEKPGSRNPAPQPPLSPRIPAPLEGGPDTPDLRLSGTSPVFQIRERAGIWQVTVNGRFHGDYTRRTAALEAVQVLSSMAI